MAKTKEEVEQIIEKITVETFGDGENIWEFKN